MGHLWLLPILVLTLHAGDPAVLGRWHSVERSKGGIGAIYEFRADGTVTFSPAAIVTGTYAEENGNLVLTLGTKSTVIKLDRRAGDLVKVTAPSGPPREMKRIGPPEAAPASLRGYWRSPWTGGQDLEQYERFRADGTYVFTLPMRPRSGYYKITKGSIWIQVANTVTEGPVARDGDTLTLPSRKGAPDKYVPY
ncbi:MAG: hypothetical protein K2X35_06815 [Bryobacteraceae bacterium]|nr:hypothetical protein [Bryobacteraceae bacterium]